METIYQNVQISREKGDLSHYIGCFLAVVIRSNIISVQLDHPVTTFLFGIVGGCRPLKVEVEAELSTVTKVNFLGKN